MHRAHEDSDSSRSEEVLRFWFGDLADDVRFDPTRRELWFRGGARHDEAIRTAFGPDRARAARGALDAWTSTPRGRLALVILLDQFSRHVHRGTPAAFAQDPQARRIALGGIDDGEHVVLHPVERAFLYLPLEHAEDLALQRRSVALHRALLAGLPARERTLYQDFLDYAVRHLHIIERFGRFPHRNKILGRESTPDELAFLERPGSSFG